MICLPWQAALISAGETLMQMLALEYLSRE